MTKIRCSIILGLLVAGIPSCNEGAEKEVEQPSHRPSAKDLVRSEDVSAVVIAIKNDNRQLIVVGSAGEPLVVRKFVQNLETQDMRPFFDSEEIEGVVVLGSRLKFGEPGSKARVRTLPIVGGLCKISYMDGEIFVVPKQLVEAVLEVNLRASHSP